uniref:TIR domain-containing protein n=1 Tax=Steinernema glaseri TaxID=37863 RepID=A0A1I8AD14_9BILA
MDNVPFAFCKHVCELLFMDYSRPSQAKELSGTYGEFSRLMFGYLAIYVCTVKDSRVLPGYVEYLSTGEQIKSPEEIEAVPKKHVRYVYIMLEDTANESACREAVQRFPYAVQYNVLLRSSSISEAWVDSACSWKRLWRVLINKKLDDKALRLFQKAITGRKIFKLTIDPDACEGGTLEITKILLCQEQFDELALLKPGGGGSKAPVRELLEFWSENSEKLTGKYVVVECTSGIEQLQEFLLKGAFSEDKELNVSGLQKLLKVCPKEECDFIDKYYLHNHRTFTIPSCVYKYEEGEGVEQRRLHISFECGESSVPSHERRPANHEGQDALHLMRET